jgi:D-3-phosphoglycerate dehydrogenase
MRCLVADDVHPVLLRELESAGLQVDYLPQLSREDFLNEIPHADILVIRSRFLIDNQVISLGSRLKIIARAGAGLDGIDVAFAESRGISVLHAAEGNSDAVAEHVLGMILGLLARIPEADRALRTGIWDREGFRGRELKGKTVGLIGYGNMGSAVASRLFAFGCRVIAYDKYRIDWPDTRTERVGPEELMHLADIISLHVPLTDETRGFINKKYLEGCKEGVILINTSRGSVLDITGLESLLDSGWLGALALDVFPEEPLFKKNIQYKNEISGLLLRQNFLASPHVAGWTSESYEKISKVLAGKILKAITH